jgi:hypothetical protein
MNVDRVGRPAAHALKDAFLTLGVLKDAFSALGVTKDAFSALRRSRPTRRTLMVTALGALDLWAKSARPAASAGGAALFSCSLGIVSVALPLLALRPVTRPRIRGGN